MSGAPGTTPPSAQVFTVSTSASAEHTLNPVKIGPYHLGTTLGIGTFGKVKGEHTNKTVFLSSLCHF